jgi:hypothetical protein
MYFQLHLNAVRGGIKSISDVAFQRAEARKHIKLSLGPRDSEQGFTDAAVPDFLVTDSMIDRWLAIDPPVFRVESDFDPIFQDIEWSYVMGRFFSALAASVVTVERMLNTARMELHPLVTPKLKELWGRGSTNTWQPNIDALLKWGYLSELLAEDLAKLFDLRCNYLHSGSLGGLQNDSIHAIEVAYRLLKELVGFPPTLFGMENGALKILHEADPLFLVFYKPHLIQEAEPSSPERSS